MQVKLLRSNSRGIEGTYDNANCHAKTLLPLLDFLRNCLEEQTGYQEWVQGNNIHLLKTKDGRTFVFRPVHEPGGYVGISFSLRVSRSVEIPLVFLNCQESSPKGLRWDAFAELLLHLPAAVPGP